MVRKKREKRPSDPVMLAARMDRAKAEGRPLDLNYDEVTGVIDVALERARDATDRGVASVRKLVEKLDTVGQEPKPA